MGTPGPWKKLTRFISEGERGPHSARIAAAKHRCRPASACHTAVKHRPKPAGPVTLP